MKKSLLLLPLLTACNLAQLPTPPLPTHQIAAGNHHSLWLSGGTVHGAGEDRFGQLGQGRVGAESNPQSMPVQGLPPVDRVFASSGGNHNLALTADGVAYGWGWNNLGQVGSGQKGEPVATPARLDVPALESAALGTGHTLALDRAGRVHVWGRNNLGQLGTGDTTERLTPTGLELPRIRAVASGINHAVALSAAGEVYTWGSNGYGQIGNGERQTGTSGAVPAPHRVSLPARAKAISAGNHNTFAILENGDLYAWGDNTMGLLGDGSAEHRPQPTRIAAVAGARQIESGGRHTLALLNDGRVLAWGDGKVGQLGDGRSGDGVAAPTPQVVALPGPATEIRVGTNHNLVRLRSGVVMGFGSNGQGRLGRPPELTVLSTPGELR